MLLPVVARSLLEQWQRRRVELGAPVWAYHGCPTADGVEAIFREGFDAGRRRRQVPGANTRLGQEGAIHGEIQKATPYKKRK